MTRVRRTALITVLIIGILLMPLTATATTGPGQIRSAPSDRIDDWITDRMAAHGIPGAAVAVVHGGEVAHLSGYGSAGPPERAVTPDTPFIIGSSSKPFTALLVRQLIDDGRLSLDEPVLPHLADLVDDVPDGFERVTVGQLLAHTGGLGMMVGLAGTVEVHDGDDALERRVRELLSQPVSAPPGERFEYSNAGAQILAAVTEQITGRPFADQLQDRIFAPLGMTRSFAIPDAPPAGDLATGHRQWFGTWQPADMPYDTAGAAMGYIASTARDLAAFLQAHLDGHDIIPVTAVDITQETVVPTGWDVPLEAGYGLGWFVDELAGQQVVSHSGSLGHFTAHLIMVPGESLGVAVLSNASAFIANGHDGQYDLSLGLTRMLLGQDPQPTAPDPLMTHVAPITAWLLVALLVATAIRHVVVTLPRWRRDAATPSSRRWVRHLVLPGLGHLALGTTILLTVPLASARHFYPDVGWAGTVLAAVSLCWAPVRTGLTALALRRPGGRADVIQAGQPHDGGSGVRRRARHASA